MDDPNLLDDLELAPGLKPEDLIFEEQGDHEKGFAAYFDAKLKPILLAENEARLDCLRQYRQRSRIAVPVMVLIIVGTIAAAALLFHGSGTDSLLKIAAFICFGLGGWMWAPRALYRRQAKNDVLPAVAGFFGFLSYSASATAPGEYLTAARLVPAGDPELQVCTDHLSGAYHDVPLDIWQLSTRRRNGRSTTTLWSGIFIRFGLKKKLEKLTLVRRRSTLPGAAFFELAFSGLEHVALEDPEFEKEFECYSSDQVEARYLLTPDVMQHLKDLSRIFGDAPVQCSFSGDSAFLSIKLAQKLFEPPPPDKSPVSSRDIHVFLDQMDHLLDIIDLLNIENR